jgi:hypothetical protein
LLLRADSFAAYLPGAALILAAVLIFFRVFSMRQDTLLMLPSMPTFSLIFTLPLFIIDCCLTISSSLFTPFLLSFSLIFFDYAIAAIDYDFHCFAAIYAIDFLSLISFRLPPFSSAVRRLIIMPLFHIFATILLRRRRR